MRRQRPNPSALTHDGSSESLWFPGPFCPVGFWMSCSARSPGQSEHFTTLRDHLPNDPVDAGEERWSRCQLLESSSLMLPWTRNTVFCNRFPPKQGAAVLTTVSSPTGNGACDLKWRWKQPLFCQCLKLIRTTLARFQSTEEKKGGWEGWNSPCRL